MIELVGHRIDCLCVNSRWWQCTWVCVFWVWWWMFTSSSVIPNYHLPSVLLSPSVHSSLLLHLFHSILPIPLPSRFCFFLVHLQARDFAESFFSKPLLTSEMICDITLSPRTVFNWNFKPSKLTFVCVVGYWPL